MKVLCVTSSYPSSLNTVAGNFVAVQVEGLRRNGIVVDVIAANMFSVKNLLKWIAFYFSSGKNKNRDSYASASMVNLWPFSSAFHAWWFKYTLGRFIKKYISEEGLPDLIHTHFSLWAGFAVAENKSLRSIPLVITEHSSLFYEGALSETELRCARIALDHANAVIAPSEFLKTSLIKYFKTITSKFWIIPNLVDQESFEEYDFSIKENSIISVGRLVQSKGFDILIKAFSMINNRENYNLIIVGDGPELNKLQNLVEKLDLHHSVSFKGTLTRTEIRKLVQRSKILVSTSFFETFGLTVAESLATGTPVLVTDKGAPGGYVNSVSGEICIAGNVNDTCMKLNFMTENYKKYQPLQIREHALRVFGEATVTKKTLELYEILLNSK